MSKRVALAAVLAILVLDHLAFVGNLFSFQVNIAVAVVLLVLILSVRAWSALHLVLYTFLFASSFFVPLGGLGAGHMLAAVGVSVLILVPTHRGRELLRWFRRGHIDRVSLLLMTLTILVAAGALVLWAENTDDLGAGFDMARGLQQMPTALVLGVVVPLFALINAFAEEVVFRGVYQEALARVVPSTWLVVPLQAAPFAALHYAAGFPNGVLGYLMVFVWGSMLGILRWRTRGMLAPWIVHVGADLVIALYLWSRVV